MNSHFDDHQMRREIQGPRPTPLRISRDSHLIHKNSSSSQNGAPCGKRQRDPIIIYTESPKIIHTQAHDFMALVQRLTGLSRSKQENETPGDASVTTSLTTTASTSSSQAASTGNSLCQAMGDVNSSERCKGFVPNTSSFRFSQANENENQSGFDSPLFTPNSTDFFCSPRQFYRFSDNLYSPPKFSPNLGSSISPTVLEVIKAFPEY
ncbi:hypothetical protein AMTRI_Chr13g85580 [Amborella trichopoda]|uniref:VQ domain-containing protein n=1 Tax=Amborella trichopoda TaxID=13333 RepID=W1P8P8_AMBTC|nr:VQ motif-containing protein 8, chloroplastic [Amborella trichopoda]ERN03981.1 hypothetical protein AMTR_s00079p00122650 [Amborella trichopoda]|eukprot:XP_006842306.1 VQ motif-containing protein 8, chloroplastic [Amborella trichopoda]